MHSISSVYSSSEIIREIVKFLRFYRRNVTLQERERGGKGREMPQKRVTLAIVKIALNAFL